MSIKLKALVSKINLYGAMLVGSLMLASIASASEQADTYPRVFLGLKTGEVSIDGADEDVSATGLILGFKINKDLSLDFERYISESIEYSTGFGTVEADGTATGAYLTGRSGIENFYFKYKLGFAMIDIDVNLAGASGSESDSGISYGIGGGANFGKAAVEVEYSVLTEDVDYLSVGVLYNF